MNHIIKFILLVAFYFSFFISCSDSDNKEASNKTKVISKITTKYLDHDGNKEIEVIETSTLNYENGNLIKINDSENKCIIFNNQGSKIMNATSCTNVNEKDIFTYSDNLLTKVSSDEVINDFLYDSDILKEIKTSYVTDNFTKKYSTQYTFLGKNIATVNQQEFWKPEPTISQYKYDNKNNPFKNHNFYHKLIWGPEFLGDNNAIEKTIGKTVIKYTIVYDADNFPIKVTGINQETGKLYTENSYEYTKI